MSVQFFFYSVEDYRDIKLLNITICHGAHSGEEWGTWDEDKLKLTVFNIKQGRARQGKADTQEHQE